MRDISKELQLPGGIASTTKVANIDPYYGVFASVEEAKSTVPDALKEVGRQFAVYKDGSNKEADVYTWAKDSAGIWFGKQQTATAQPNLSGYATTSYVDGKVSSVYRVKGSVASFANLPAGASEGDVYNLIDTGKNIVWVSNLNNTGAAGWDDLGGMVDISGKLDKPTGTTATSAYVILADGSTKAIDKFPYTPVNNTLTSTSTTDALSAAQGKALNDLFTNLNTQQITITTAVNITSATTGSITGLPQHTRLVNIDNGVNAITVTLQAAADSGFFATYFKAGAGAVTFAVESGQTLVQLDGISVMNGAVGSMALVKRFGNTFYLRIYNA